MNLKGAVVIVTGSATGLGSEVAKQTAAKGANVLVNYTKSEPEAAATVDACRKLGADTLLCRGDVSVDEDCRKMASQAIERWGRIDGLVNNAGQSVFASHADLEALSGEDFLRIYSINVVGPYQMARAVTPQMKKQGLGAIVNVSSIAGITGSGSSIAYAASKGALNTMTVSLARALAPEIRVNAVCPALFQSRWWSDGLGEERSRAVHDQFAAATPLKAAPTQKSVADSVVWLLESAEHVTGETLMVDAGVHLLGFQPS